MNVKRILEVVSVVSHLEGECESLKQQREPRGRSEGLITDLAGESPRRYTPRRGAELHQDPAAGYRWLWPFHRSAPEAAAHGKTINIQSMSRYLWRKKSLLGSVTHPSLDGLPLWPSVAHVSENPHDHDAGLEICDSGLEEQFQ